MITEEMKEMTRRFVEALNPEQVILFGSYARGDYNKDSDYDFYIIMPDTETERRTVLTGKAYESLISMGMRTSVDIIVHNKSHFEKRKDYFSLEREVNRDGVVLYGELQPP